MQVSPVRESTRSSNTSGSKGSRRGTITVLREEVDSKKAKGDGGTKGDAANPHSILANYKPFELLKIYVLRQYLEQVEFPLTSFIAFETLNFAFDFESIVDDFVFLCMFVGNDFLPHLPSLEIREGALEVKYPTATLILVYSTSHLDSNILLVVFIISD